MKATTLCGTIRRPLLAALFLLALSVSRNASAQLRPDSMPEPVQRRFVIESVRLHIEGLTMESALSAYLDIRVGKLFGTEADLGDYIVSKERLLRDNRVFDISSSVRAEIAGEGNPVPVRVVVRAKDSWTALAAPFPKFSVDEGLSLAIRYKDFNFLGTLKPLTLDLDQYFSPERTTLGAAFGMYPRMFGNTWLFAFDGSMRHEAAKSVSADYAFSSLSSDYLVGDPGKAWTITPALDFAYDIDETPPTLSATATLARRFGGTLDWNLSALTGYKAEISATFTQSIIDDLSLSLSIPLARLPGKATLSLNPSASASLDLAIPGFAPSEPTLAAGATLGYSAVDWIGNFRRGSSASVSASSTWYWMETDPARKRDIILSLEAKAFASTRNLAGIDVRLVGRWDLSWTMYGDQRNVEAVDWGSYLRGVAGIRRGDLALVANLEFPVNFAQGRFFGWSKLEAEVFLIPFVDAGLIRPDPRIPLDFAADTALCAGLDLAVFPRYARSFVYRLSLGYDLIALARSGAFDPGNIEGWLGIGLHF